MNVDGMQVIYFSAKKVRMCIALNCIHKIIPLTNLERLPTAPNYVAGLLYIEGKIVPVIDLALFLGLNHHDTYTLTTPIILCQVKDQYVGIIVDHIIGIHVLEKNSLKMQEEFNPHQEASPFLGVVNIKNEVALMLNCDFILHSSLNMKSAENWLEHEVIAKVVRDD